MKKTTFLTVMLFAIISLGFGQANPGDIAFTAFNADGDDDFAIVTLVDIPASTTIYFTDNEPSSDGSGLADTNEGILKWVSSSSIISAGTIVIFTDASSGSRVSSVGTFTNSSGSFNLSGGGDAMYAYIGSSSVEITSWLAGIQNESGNQGANFAQTGLTVGTTFINFYTSGSPDGGVYSGVRTNEAAFSDYLTLLGNSSNWTTQTSSGELILPISTTSFTIGGGSSVPAPVFTPTAGNYYTTQQVTIELPADKNGYTIYYTKGDDPADPDNTSTAYTVPIEVDATTTIKAVTYDGAFYSDVETAVYTLVETTPIATLADLRAAYENKAAAVYALDGEVILTFIAPPPEDSRYQKFVQDATAGILIDDASGTITTVYDRYDGITGLIGTLSEYKGMLQFSPVTDPGAASSTANSVTPVELSIEEMNDEHETYESMLVTIMASSFDENVVGNNFVEKTNYDISNNDDFTGVFRTNYEGLLYEGDPIPSGNIDITGVMIEYEGTAQIVARELDDFEVSDTPLIPIGSAGIVIAALLMTAVIVTRKRLF